MHKTDLSIFTLPMLLGLFLIGISTSCAPIITKHRMAVSHETIPCPDSIRTTCMLVKIDSATEWSPWPMSKEIFGFNYTSGFTYDLAVEEVQKRNKKTPPWWRLTEVMSREEYVRKDPKVYNTNWLLTEYGEAGSLATPMEGIRITLDFSGFGSISGKAPCNRYFAECSFPGENLMEISNPGSTRMACLSPEGVMQLEAEYLKMLSEVFTYQQQSGVLTLETESGSQLVFQQIFE